MFEEAMERIRRTTGLRTQVLLAACLGIRQSSISDAKRRDTVPDSWLVGLYERYDLNPTWIRSGEGPAFLMGDPDRIGPVVEPAQPLPPAPEPSVTDLKAALEARLGCGLRVVIVGADEQVTTASGGAARTEAETEAQERGTACNAI